MVRVSEYHLNKIKKYFYKNYSYLEICHFMAKKHNYDVSLRTLKRILAENGLRRKKIQSSLESIVIAIQFELEGSGFNLGYRSMTRRLQKVYGLVVQEKTVMQLLKIIDPEGVLERRRYRLRRRQYKVKGPNFLWHIGSFLVFLLMLYIK